MFGFPHAQPYGGGWFAPAYGGGMPVRYPQDSSYLGGYPQEPESFFSTGRTPMPTSKRAARRPSRLDDEDDDVPTQFPKVSRVPIGVDSHGLPVYALAAEPPKRASRRDPYATMRARPHAAYTYDDADAEDDSDEDAINQPRRYNVNADHSEEDAAAGDLYSALFGLPVAPTPQQRPQGRPLRRQAPAPQPAAVRGRPAADAGSGSDRAGARSRDTGADAGTSAAADEAAPARYIYITPGGAIYALGPEEQRMLQEEQQEAKAQEAERSRRQRQAEEEQQCRAREREQQQQQQQRLAAQRLAQLLGGVQPAASQQPCSSAGAPKPAAAGRKASADGLPAVIRIIGPDGKVLTELLQPLGSAATADTAPVRPRKASTEAPGTPPSEGGASGSGRARRCAVPTAAPALNRIAVQQQQQQQPASASSQRTGDATSAAAGAAAAAAAGAAAGEAQDRSRNHHHHHRHGHHQALVPRPSMELALSRGSSASLASIAPSASKDATAACAAAPAAAEPKRGPRTIPVKVSAMPTAVPTAGGRNTTSPFAASASAGTGRAADAAAPKPAPASVPSKRVVSMSPEAAARAIQRRWRGWRLWRHGAALRRLAALAGELRTAGAKLYAYMGASGGWLNHKQLLEVNELSMRTLLNLDSFEGLPMELRALKKRLTGRALGLQDQAQEAYARSKLAVSNAAAAAGSAEPAAATVPELAAEPDDDSCRQGQPDPNSAAAAFVGELTDAQQQQQQAVAQPAPQGGEQPLESAPSAAARALAEAAAAVEPTSQLPDALLRAPAGGSVDAPEAGASSPQPELPADPAAAQDDTQRQGAPEPAQVMVLEEEEGAGETDSTITIGGEATSCWDVDPEEAVDPDPEPCTPLTVDGTESSNCGCACDDTTHVLVPEAEEGMPLVRVVLAVRGMPKTACAATQTD